MTDSMVERVARAISGAPFPSPRSMAKARAAIEALRDATPEMRSAGHQAIRGMGDVAAVYKVNPCWQAMLDMALETPQKPAEDKAHGAHQS